MLVASTDADDKLEVPRFEEESEEGDKAAPKSFLSSLLPEKMVSLVAAVGITTLVAAAMGISLGTWTAGNIEKAITKRQAAEPLEQHKVSIKYNGDMVIQPVKPVIANLASPSDTWVRLETSIVFQNGAVDNPDVTAAEIGQDILAYIRTAKLAQLEGPSALQHLREDLNERVRLRTDSQVSELLIQTLVVQ